MDLNYYNFVFLILFGVLNIVQLAPVPFKRLTKEELNQIGLACLDEVNIERSIIDNVLKTQDLPKDNPKYRAFLVCSYKKQGYLTPDGTTMIYSNVFEFLKTFYKKSDLEQLNHCKKIQEDDAGDLVYKNLECILNGLKKIEAENGIKSNANIEEEKSNIYMEEEKSNADIEEENKIETNSV